MVRTGRLRTSDRRTRLLGTGAKQRGEHMPESATALFTVRDGGVLCVFSGRLWTVTDLFAVTGPISC